MRPRWNAVLMVALLAGCTATPRPGAADAAVVDAGPDLPDGAQPGDAGHDAGDDPLAGLVDAGRRPDAGFPLDAGVDFDAGVLPGPFFAAAQSSGSGNADVVDTCTLNGSTVVLGRFHVSMTLGGRSVSAPVMSAQQWFLARMDSPSRALWLIRLAAFSGDARVACGADASVTVALFAKSPGVVFPGAAAASSWQQFARLLVVRVDDQGTPRWTSQGSWAGELPGAITTWPSGGVAVAGSSVVDVDMGGGVLITVGEDAPTPGAGFLVQLHPNGVPAWGSVLRGSAGSHISCLATTPTGALYVLGTFGGSAAGLTTVLSPGLPDSVTLRSASASAAAPAFDTFVARFRDDHSLEWARMIQHAGAAEDAITCATHGEDLVLTTQALGGAVFEPGTTRQLELDARRVLARVDADGTTPWASSTEGGDGLFVDVDGGVRVHGLAQDAVVLDQGWPSQTVLLLPSGPPAPGFFPALLVQARVDADNGRLMGATGFGMWFEQGQEIPSAMVGTLGWHGGMLALPVDGNLRALVGDAFTQQQLSVFTARTHAVLLDLP